MYFTSKFASLLLAIAASTINVGAAAIESRNELAELSVIFWDDVGFTGASFSPDIVQAECSTLPGNWLDRPESVQIAAGFTCNFYVFEGCEGTGHLLSGNVANLPNPPLYNAIESLSCNKEI